MSEELKPCDFPMDRESVERRADEMVISAGGYCCDKKSAYRSGYQLGLYDAFREAVNFLNTRAYEAEIEELKKHLVACNACGDDLTEQVNDLERINYKLAAEYHDSQAKLSVALEALKQVANLEPFLQNKIGDCLKIVYPAIQQIEGNI